MSSSLHFPRLYAIFDAQRLAPEPVPEVAESLLAAGVRMFQYRDKHGASRAVYDASQRLAAFARDAGAIFIVNDRADIALAAGADGVHLGQDDLPACKARKILSAGQLIGLSTHSLEQVEQANREPVDYVAFGPVFATRSKERPDPVVGLSGLRAARQLTSKPLVAIGGIDLRNAGPALEAGADAVAVIDALFSAPDIAARAGALLQVVENYREGEAE